MNCQSSRRKSSSFSGEEELRKMPRLWIHGQDHTGMQGNIEQSLHGSDVSSQHNQQQQNRPNESVPLSLQAAIALQEIRSSIDQVNKHNLFVQQPQQQSTMVQQPDIKFQLQQQQEQQRKALLDIQQQQMPRTGNVPVHPVEPMFSPSSGRGPSNPLIPCSSSPSSQPCSSSRLVQAKQFHTQQPSNVWFPSASGMDLPRAMVPSPVINSMFSLEFPERAIAVSGGLLVDQKQLEQPVHQSKLPSFINGTTSIPMSKHQMPAASVYAAQVKSIDRNSRSSTISNSNIVNTVNQQRSLSACNLVEQTAGPATPPLDGSKDRKKKDSCTKEAEQAKVDSAPITAVQQRPPVRTFTKVYKLGSIGRAIDVARFKNYAELKAELSRMFGLDGQLDQNNGWQLVFVDKENDLLLVGDDPWQEFVSSVRGIRILSPSEVSYYTSEEPACLV